MKTEKTIDNVIPKRTWKLPIISMPSFIEDIEELLPNSHLLNGLSLSEDDKKIYIEASVPGVDPKDIDITFDKGIVTIRGEKKEDENDKRYQRHATRSFLYRVAPGDIDPRIEPEAGYKNGVMYITFTKLEIVQPKKIMVKAL